MKNFGQIMDQVIKAEVKTVSVAVAQDRSVLEAVKKSIEIQMAKAILVGDKKEIIQIANDLAFSLEDTWIIDEPDKNLAARRAVELVSKGKADALMKGMVDTSVILKAVLDKDIGLRTGNVLSHAAVFSVKTYHKMLIVTDAAMNIEPELDKKRQILENAVGLAHSLGIARPKCAVICAKESVSTSMRHTVDAEKLVKLNEEGIISGCLVGGPFALDNAISREAALHKGIKHEVAGDADILLMPQIESGNVLYKAMTFLAQAESAGIILGAKAPIILTSRADSNISKLNSIALALLHA
jgi:phosphate butyryltransferase